MMVNGTESNMPTGPNSQPQKINDKNTTKVESPKFSCLSASSTGVTRFSPLLLPELAQRAVLTDFIF